LANANRPPCQNELSPNLEFQRLWLLAWLFAPLQRVRPFLISPPLGWACVRAPFFWSTYLHSTPSFPKAILAAVKPLNSGNILRQNGRYTLGSQKKIRSGTIREKKQQQQQWDFRGSSAACCCAPLPLLLLRSLFGLGRSRPGTHKKNSC